MPCNLMLHCGAHAVERKEVWATPTPAGTSTWQPIPHAQLLTQVESVLPRYGLSVINEAHALTHDSNRYFGLMEIRNGCSHPDYTWVLGLRNSNDQRFPAGFVVGNQVFVCDNLAFMGEIIVSRKHTRFILRDLPDLIDQAVGQLASKWHEQDERISRYKNHRITNPAAHDITVRAMDAGIIGTTRIPDVLDEWRKPSHDAFRPRTLWSLFNAFTEVLKGRLQDLPSRTQRLYTLCDERCGLN